MHSDPHMVLLANPNEVNVQGVSTIDGKREATARECKPVWQRVTCSPDESTTYRWKLVYWILVCKGACGSGA